MPAQKGAPNLMQRLSRLPAAPNVTLLDCRKPKPFPWPYADANMIAAAMSHPNRLLFKPNALGPSLVALSPKYYITFQKFWKVGLTTSALGTGVWWFAYRPLV